MQYNKWMRVFTLLPQTRVRKSRICLMISHGTDINLIYFGIGDVITDTCCDIAYVSICPPLLMPTRASEIVNSYHYLVVVFGYIATLWIDG